MATKELERSKPWYLSTGVIGSVSAMVAGILGIWYGDIDAGHIEVLLASGASFVGGVIALIGRIKATKKIG